jgi:hypothetical protein
VCRGKRKEGNREKGVRVYIFPRKTIGNYTVVLHVFDKMMHVMVIAINVVAFFPVICFFQSKYLLNSEQAGFLRANRETK